MITYTQNLTEKLKGKWKCKGYDENDSKITDFEVFHLVFSENMVSCLPRENSFWPRMCIYEAIGTKNGGYFFREDGCFFQVKNVSEYFLHIELNLKINEDGRINKYLFYFEMEKE
ncbi:hypothetical protein JKA74_12715 [Marivirga sp. S37H4]|uniref:Uncharacterized protein n=1 Tax=Marivirga aurantiaca TaxID=2802615 RepID=A0A934WZV5_9BACT|nr:hypothetical protein [Marivirga aurantiaca]MBK6265897.1 hypothetical protein [Marivirga aurantiaca]